MRLREALTALHAQRPGHVPAGAALLVAWVDLPGENTARTQHWTAAQLWKDPIRAHFQSCAKVLGLKGPLSNPQVYIELYVAVPGDAINSLSRAKYVIDKLQPARVSTYRQKGKLMTRTKGLLGLIEDDKHLNVHSCQVKEIRTAATAKANPRRVQVWVWEGA